MARRQAKLRWWRLLLGAVGLVAPSLAFAERAAERPENLQRVLREMWRRNEGGWMAEALKRVRDMDQLLVDAQKDRPSLSPKGSRPARAATCTPRKT